MNRYVSPVARAGATAVAAATGLLVLASTGQTPSGFVPASFGGPLGLFDSSAVNAMNDVVTIGGGPADAKELATLLKSAGPIPSSASGPLQATFTPGAVPNTAGLSVTPAPGVASATTDKQSLPVKPVLDSQGKVDCSKAVSCKTDPATNVTTVTYPDGVVAFVQQINDLTLVAYKTVGQVIQDGIDALIPKGPAPQPAAVAPAPAPAPAPVPVVPVVAAPAPDPVPVKTPVLDARTDPAPVEAGPVAPSAPAAPDISAATVRPQLTISNPPLNFDEDKPASSTPGNPGAALGAVKDAVGSVVDAVAGAVGKAIGPGAVTEKPDSSSDSSSTASQNERKSEGSGN